MAGLKTRHYTAGACKSARHGRRPLQLVVAAGVEAAMAAIEGTVSVVAVMGVVMRGILAGIEASAGAGEEGFRAISLVSRQRFVP